MPKTPEKSKSDLLREHISRKLDSNFDYSTLSNKKIDLLEFMKLNKVPEKQYGTLYQLHNKMLKDVLKKKNIAPESIGLSARKPSVRSSTTIQPTITPKPQQSSAPIQSTTETTSQVSSTGQVQPMVMIPETYSKESVKAVFHALFIGVKQFAKEAEDLSEAELESLGELWKGIFNKYLHDKGEIIIAVVATAGIFIPKLAKGRKKKTQEKIEKKEEKPEAPKTEAPKETNSKNPISQTEIDKTKSEEIKKLEGDEAFDA